MKVAFTITFLLIAVSLSGQQALSFQEAREIGIYPKIEEEYKSAIHSDPDLAVFKTEEESKKLVDSYVAFLKELGAFLSEQGYKWEESTHGFNRIYIESDGTIDYFIYDLKKLDQEKIHQFQQLLQEYIGTHKFGITAPVKFAQCSPVTYPKSE